MSNAGGGAAASDRAVQADEFRSQLNAAGRSLSAKLDKRDLQSKNG
jgi:hypothetical protein